MSHELPMPEIARREGNFFNGVMSSAIDGKMYYVELQWLAEDIKNVLTKLQGVGCEENILRLIFSRVYDFVIAHNDMTNDTSYDIFDDGKDVYDDAFEACFFISLCEFLYDTRRIRGMSLRKLIYENSPREYNVKGSPNYFDIDNKPREFCESNSDRHENSSNLILGDETALRQYRKRLLDKRPVYQHSSEWSAIRKVSEHEWELYFILESADPEIRDTFKRLRVLYSALNKALNSPLDDGYINRLEVAFNKFSSKLKKIQYVRFLNLGKFCLNHICKDTTCYGINLYRFEKELRLYAVTGEVRRLLNCKTIDEEQDILTKSIVLKDIPFPKLYEYFGNLENIRQSEIYVRVFWCFMDDLVRSSRLIIDKFVEEGTFGEDWENLFLDITNKLAMSVLYDPKAIDYSVEPGSQEMFEKDISAPTEAWIAHMTGLWRYRLDPSDSEDDMI